MEIKISVVGTAGDVEQLLRDGGHRPTRMPAGTLAALADPLAAQPDVVVIDVRGQAHLPMAVSAIRRQHPGTGVLLITSALDPTLMLEAMRAGVTECVTDPLSRDDLEAAVQRLLTQRPAQPKGGEVYAFVGAKGGVGATTVAVNVATALARFDVGETLLIDLHLANGDAAVFLGAEPRFSIVDALENTHRLDEAFFRSLVTHTKSGVDLLASAERALVSPVDARRIRTIVDFAAARYRYVVLDVPRSDASVLDSLEQVGRIVIIANQELATVRNATRMAATLRQRYGREKLSVVLSRSDRLAEIGHEDVERALGGAVRHTFPSDYRTALNALNKGRPVTLDNHNELSSSFVKFAQDLAGVEAKRPAERSAGLFGRLVGRR